MKKTFLNTATVFLCATVLSTTAFAWGSTKNIDEPSAKISAAEQAEVSIPSSDKLNSAVKSVKQAIADAVSKSDEKADEKSTEETPATPENAPANDATPVDDVVKKAQSVSENADAAPATSPATTKVIAANTAAAKVEETATPVTDAPQAVVEPLAYCPSADQLHKEDIY